MYPFREYVDQYTVQLATGEITDEVLSKPVEEEDNYDPEVE